MMFVKCKDCFYKDDCKDALCDGYCPNNEEEDYSSAVYRELKEQNGDL